jgi:hypothetical protein
VGDGRLEVEKSGSWEMKKRLIGPIGWFVEFVVFVGGFEFFHSTFDVGRSMFDVRFFSPSNPRILGSFSYEHRMSTLEGQKPEFCTATGLPFT